MPLPADNNISRTPSPSKKVGFIFEVSSEPNNSQTMNIESSTHQSHTGSTTGTTTSSTPTPAIIQTPITTFPLMKGRIYKQPTSISANRSFNIMKQWTKRYMILESMTYILKYGVSEAALCSSNGIKGSIQLQVGMNCIKGKKNKCFELYLGNSCILRSIAETDDERDRWIHAIQTAIQDLEALVRRQGSK